MCGCLLGSKTRFLFGGAELYVLSFHGLCLKKNVFYSRCAERYNCWLHVWLRARRWCDGKIAKTKKNWLPMRRRCVVQQSTSADVPFLVVVCVAIAFRIRSRTGRRTKWGVALPSQRHRQLMMKKSLISNLENQLDADDVHAQTKRAAILSQAPRRRYWTVRCLVATRRRMQRRRGAGK